MSSRQARVYRAGQSSRRLVAVFVIAAILFLAVLARVTILQTVQADGLRSAGKSQRTSESLLKAHRGTIFDREGADLALSVPARTVIANPKLVLDPAGTVRTLDGTAEAPASKQKVVDSMRSRRRRTRSCTSPGRSTHSSRRPSSTCAWPESRRSAKTSACCRQATSARSVVGRTDPDLQGTAGLEKEYDDILRGVDGEQSQEHDREFRSIAGGDETVAPVPGSDIVTTLDRGLQYQVEQALMQRVNALSALGGTAIVMGVNSGDIYSVANVRRDDGGVAQVTSADLAATEPHEPGSVAKVFSIAAAINEGLATPDTTMMVPGFLVYKPVNKSDEKWKFKIRDAEPHNDELMSLRDIIVHSSNIGTVLMTEGLGTLKFGDYLHEFGFGSTTGLGLPDESAGIMKPAADWQATEKVTPRYGYGYAATSLQLISGVNTIANGGTYVAPRLVLSTIDANGPTHDAPASPTHEVVTPAHRHCNDVDDERRRVLRHGEVRQGPWHDRRRQDRHSAVEAHCQAGRPDRQALPPHRSCSRLARPTRRPTPTTRPPTARRSTTRPSSATSRPTTRRSRSSFRSTVPTRRTRITSAARPLDHCSRRWPPWPCTSSASAPPNDTGCQNSADDPDVSHASRGGRAGGARPSRRRR